MPKRQLLFEDMRRPNSQAALLVAQVGAMPTELQIVLQSAEYDEAAEGLRPLHSFLVRASGVLEHQINSLGMTVGNVELLTEHPLLYQYTEAPTALFFRGQVADVNALALDIAQAHASTFGPWRHFPAYLNPEQPLVSLLESGGGLLGQMPASLAQRIVQVLTHHGLEHKLVSGTPEVAIHKNPMLQDAKLPLLLLGDSYIIAYSFSFDELGKA